MIRSNQWSESFRARFSDLLARHGGPGKAGAKIRYTNKQVANWRDGRSSPRLFEVAALCRDVGVSLDWLVHGEDGSGVLSHGDVDRIVKALALYGREDDDAADRLRELHPDTLRADRLMAEALDWYGRTRGRFSADDRGLFEVLPFSVVHRVPDSGLPVYCYCGEGSVAAAYYGAEFASDPEAHRAATDPKLERLRGFSIGWCRSPARLSLSGSAPLSPLAASRAACPTTGFSCPSR